MLESAEIASESVLDALGNPLRRDIVRILAEKPTAVGDIARRLPVSRPAVSKHLRLLEQSKLVTAERQGNRTLFRLRRSGFDAARHWLESFWDEALENLVGVAEGTHAKS